ncbi:MAG: rhodanese-like domain-containing protein [Spirochaetales bacterium]|nr:rhodanese-like domain-containing protein [Spirochaetales bacterium]
MTATIRRISRKLTSFFNKDEYYETGYTDERFQDPVYLKNFIESGAIDYCLVDSRDTQDFAKGHILTAKSVPYYSIEGNLPSENLFTIIIVYGYTKRSSIKAAEVLSELGYFNVVAFGSYSKWTECFGE